MANRKERLIQTLSATGAPRDNVAAVGMAQSISHHARQVENAQRAVKQAALVALGMDTLALKHGLRPDIHRRAVERLSAEIFPRLGYIAQDSERLAVSDDLARAALQEHVVDMCPSCKGAKEIPDFAEREGMQPMKMCPACNGTGGRAYSDEERAEALAQPLDSKVVQFSFRASIEIIQTAEKMAIQHWAEVLK